jgi:hypothetical protein
MRTGSPLAPHLPFLSAWNYRVHGGFASGRAVLVRDAHRQLCWLAISAAATISSSFTS